MIFKFTKKWKMEKSKIKGSKFLEIERTEWNNG